jgi:ligand-binding sensor protein
MKLSDVSPLEQWVELERQINDRFGLNAAVYDKDGFRITDYENWVNRLCPVVKAHEMGQSSICALANQNMMAQAMQTRKPVIEECDAGLAKIIVPIFVDDEFLGVAGGCGILLDDGEVDSFLVSKITGIDEEEIQGLSADIRRIATDKAESLIRYVQEQIDGIVRDFKKQV